ncbi:ABC transporter permease [Cohnella luojiensis]|uniref:Sugar ABC transporter permease n=1 Tax=Cohnella luojiensis TaxID=652876 RepID=A0A4Y8LZP0_9BACL|nr:ABC transporter permease subunit [Cohnella luojiensis]TFE26903.1 sugar ABC transporter permease [Cohnella luojiensis]
MQNLMRRIVRERQIWIMAVPMIAWVLVFSYYPMYGMIISFQNYVPGNSFFSGDWVGFAHFERFFSSPDFLQVMRNTLAMSGLNILFGLPAPLILALLLNELRNKTFKRVTQTLSYIPYFISWVVVASILFTLLGSDGLLNRLLLDFGMIKDPISFLGEGKYFWTIITASNIWKDIGFNSIIYLSALASIDRELLDAGKVDGISRFGTVWHIYLPGIRTTIILLWILGIGGILNAGFEQQLLLGSPTTSDYSEVVDTYVYKYGVQLGYYSFASAVNLLKAVVSVVLVLSMNRIAKKLFDTSIV